ncbi:hypothetical protein [Janthinobacterium sp. PC23-8]|uniref:hypothetical protein n=1 Tax=Janthinobacterium sp. PC23-8 TaxID=2012679 RepID=UPI0015955A7C|nr:hypothetical protein [Janthinobacterium sp. PC23-8]
MSRKSVCSVNTSIGDRLLRFACLCASLSPALAGMPQLMEYAWTYMISVSRATSK